MKKILFAVMAFGALVACTNEEVIEMDREQIGFGEAFVDNGTKSDYNTTGREVTAFKVYGTATGSGNTVQIFNADDVKNTYGTTTVGYGAAWYCDNIQFWLPGVEYHFAAIVDGTATATLGLPESIPFTVTNGEGDLLYATRDVTTNANAAPQGLADDGLVDFTFSHLLSKVQFTVTNSIENYNIQVTGISVTGAAKEGLCTLANTPKWAQTSTSTTDAALTFGTTGSIATNAEAVASETRQILPVKQSLAVTVAYDIYFGDTKISSTTKTGNITNYTFEENKVYNIDVEISGNQIKFTVKEVGGFSDTTDVTIS